MAQKAGADPAKAVEATAKAHRLLTPQEVDALLDAYRSGVGVCELARNFEISRQTVARHLERGAVAKRPTVKMTPPVTARARGLYESGMTVEEVAQVLGIGPSTIWRALKRAGTKMRPQAPRVSPRGE